MLNLEEVQAVIDSAKARGREPLERYIRGRLSGATDQEVEEATDVAVEIIESMPVLLARASQRARERSMGVMVEPVLEQARRYFIQPVDVIPEMTHGLAGLLDDSYLTLKILQSLDRGQEPFLDWDLIYPATFIRRIVGPKVSRQLDAISVGAMEEMGESLDRLWHHMGHRA